MLRVTHRQTELNSLRVIEIRLIYRNQKGE